MPSINLSLKDRKVLLDTARHAIQYGLTYQKSPALELEKYSSRLREHAASFVTLKESNQLRGCIGSLKAYQPLIQDVADHAFSAAFEDHRFPPVNAIEEPLMHISISILSAPKDICFSSEKDLLQQIRIGVDGLILNYKNTTATFLPAVWEQLTTPELFLSQLKLKAGLEADFWHQSIKISRYTCEYID